MKITKPQIVAAALELLDEVGLDALTTRKLAERLGVQQPTLYWHFKTRDALLAAISTEILVRHHTYTAPKPGDDWQSFLTRQALSFRAALAAHRDGARLYALAGADAPALPPEAQLRFLTAQGLELGVALHLGLAIARYTLGCALQAGDLASAGADDEPLVAGAHDLLREGPEATFRHGLRLLIDGADLTLG